jgi:Leucine-rich repeat (LRR) protein
MFLGGTMNKFNRTVFNKIYKEANSKKGWVDNLDISRLHLKELPEFFKDLTVEGSFWVYRNQLTSCKNFPRVGRVLDASNNEIISLDEMQNTPNKHMVFMYNKIESLERLREFSGECSTINIHNNKLTSFAGLENLSIVAMGGGWNDITSWEGIPTGIKNLYIQHNKLTSWKGMPSGLFNIYVNHNWDVKDFNDFKLVKTSVKISSSKFKTEHALYNYFMNNSMEQYLEANFEVIN